MSDFANLSPAQLIELLETERAAHQAIKAELAQAKNTIALLQEHNTKTQRDASIKMPDFKMQRDKESTCGAGSCTKANCQYLHQAQVDRFGAAAIEALPRDRDERFATRKAGGFQTAMAEGDAG